MPIPAPLSACLLLAAACLAGGCGMQRTLIVDSEPTGARIWVEGAPRGVTPVAIPYVHPGAYHVRLEKPGYVSLAEDVHVASTRADYPVLDLPSEIIGGHKRVTRVLRLTPLPPAPSAADLEGLRERAREFRARAHREVAEPGTPRPQGR